MYNTTYVSKMITDNKESEINAENLNMYAIMKDTQTSDVIRMPYSTITSKYRDKLSGIVETIYLTDSEMFKYKYRPKAFCLSVYKTTELWSSILELNGMTSILDFTKPMIKAYNPRKLTEFLNELFILEGKIK